MECRGALSQHIASTAGWRWAPLLLAPGWHYVLGKECLGFGDSVSADQTLSLFPCPRWHTPGATPGCAWQEGRHTPPLRAGLLLQRIAQPIRAHDRVFG